MKEYSMWINELGGLAYGWASRFVWFIISLNNSSCPTKLCGLNKIVMDLGLRSDT
jgi:hypothetical protein